MHRLTEVPGYDCASCDTWWESFGSLAGLTGSVRYFYCRVSKVSQDAQKDQVRVHTRGSAVLKAPPGIWVLAHVRTLQTTLLATDFHARTFHNEEDTSIVNDVFCVHVITLLLYHIMPGQRFRKLLALQLLTRYV